MSILLQTNFNLAVFSTDTVFDETNFSIEFISKSLCEILVESEYAPTERSVRDFITSCCTLKAASAEQRMLVVLFAEESEVIGFSQFRWLLSDADLDFIQVAAHARGLGAARAMLTAGMENLRARGVKRLLLEVGVANLSAISLYKRYGFAEISKRKNYYKSGEDALVMELEI